MNIQGNLEHLEGQSLVRDRGLEFKNEIESLDISAQKMILKKLNFLSFQIDPYDTDILSSEEKNIISEFRLANFMDNPFEFTNILLKMIDITEIEINKKHQ